MSSCKFVLILLAVIKLCSPLSLELEAEDGRHNGNVHSRSEASGLQNVYLHQGEYVENSFTTSDDCTASVTNIAYSNDGGADLVRVSIDGSTVGSFTTVAASGSGRFWNVIRNSGRVGGTVSLSDGRSHTLRLDVTTADRFGVEIDKSTLDVVCQGTATLPIGSTATVQPTTTPFPLVCLPSSPLSPNSMQCPTVASIRQQSTNTTCAEEDNVHIPLFYAGVTSFTITASLPAYYPSHTVLNNRNADFSGCGGSLVSRLIWQIGTNDNSGDEFDHNCQITTYVVGQPVSTFCGLFDRVGQQETVVFSALGTSTGNVQASIGSILTVRFTQVSGNLELNVQVYGRMQRWLDLGNTTFTASRLEHSWQIPDLTWTETQNGNNIMLQAVGRNSFTGLVDYIKLETRSEAGETVYHVHNDGTVIVEAVAIDFWWLYPQSITILNLVDGALYHNMSYFRIYRQIPGTSNFAQLFVLYQDGNARILTYPPTGYDWIPFGSSVIIGPTDPSLERPYASISQVDIHPSSLYMIVHYRDGSSARLDLQSTPNSTQVSVSHITYFTDSSVPFATFRSMWVEDGNSDVDRVTTEAVSHPVIVGGWEEVRGTEFLFHRSCVSKHNTLSPDIRIEVECVQASTAMTSSVMTATSSPLVSMFTTATESVTDQTLMSTDVVSRVSGFNSTLITAFNSTLIVFCAIIVLSLT